MTVVLDASALLVFLQGEAGSGVVEQALLAGGAVIGAANWCEVAGKVLRAGRDWELTRGLVLSYGARIETVTAADAETAAAMALATSGLSLGDRLCVALAARLEAKVLTADRAWEGMPGAVVIR